ncbi:hypothetical protein DOY81_007387 [Sarcophaga bullata]|nr:hypothetical protein DOY81_007387 [Sarcophaga bullata]
MHHLTKTPHFNNAKYRNNQISISQAPSEIRLYPGHQEINTSCLNNKSDSRTSSFKRSSLQINNIPHTSQYFAHKNSNRYQNLHLNKQNSSNFYFKSKYSSTLSSKTNIASENNWESVKCHKSDDKVVLATRNLNYKKCQEILKSHQNGKENQQISSNKKCSDFEGPLCLSDGNEKTDGAPISCNIFPKVAKPQTVINKQVEDKSNQIPFQYRLTSENGPAHCKRFTVTLRLGNEEYTAEGLKIKKAQHLAAKEAIEKTKYKHPVPKTSRQNDNEVAKNNLTPTVELNALAMKLGQQTYYILDTTQIHLSEKNLNYDSTPKFKAMPKPNVNQNWLSNKIENCYPQMVQSAHTNKFNQLNVPVASNFSNSFPCKITLIVGTQKFFGIGRTPQQAKHNAATNALLFLKKQLNCNQLPNHVEHFDGNEQKSPISLVFEIGIKRNMAVDFKVLREEGPAHMRTFTTACIVGNIITEGEGTGKKLSKKKAAQKMLQELNKLPPLSPALTPNKRTKIKAPSKKIKSFSANSVSDIQNINNQTMTVTDLSNSVTKLLEWHQNNKQKEPIFNLISESGKENSRRRQFVMEIKSNNITVRGVGNSKKLAKRNAAQNFLNALSERNEIHSTESRNISPSLLHVNSTDGTGATREHENSILSTDVSNEKEQNLENSGDSIKKSMDTVTATKAYSLKLNNTAPKISGLQMKDQLMYLANLLGFEVDFSDYPKGNHKEFLTVVMLSTNPPQICHGVGINSKESQEDAAKNALKILSEMGLNNAVK